MQPFVGVLSDKSQCRWGRRRPYIVGGTLAAVSSMLALAYVRQIVQMFSLENEYLEQNLVLACAITLVYFLNISIQPVQMGIRALLIENSPQSRQSVTSAWASYLTGVGSILGYISGVVDLPRLFSSLSLTQFQLLTIIASCALVFTVSLSCIAVTESNSSAILQTSSIKSAGWRAIVKELKFAFRILPQRILTVYQIQFCAWLAWFPFLYYGST